MIAMCCSGIFAGAQIVIGLTIGSMALVSDSVHMFADVITYIINLYAECSTDTEDKVRLKSLLAAGFSLTVMVGVSIMITVVSVQSLLDKEKEEEEDDDLDPRIIVLMGGLGLLFDGITVAAFLIYPSFHHSHSHSHGGCDHDDGDDDDDDNILSLPNMSSAFVRSVRSRILLSLNIQFQSLSPLCKTLFTPITRTTLNSLSSENHSKHHPSTNTHSNIFFENTGTCSG